VISVHSIASRDALNISSCISRDILELVIHHHHKDIHRKAIQHSLAIRHQVVECSSAS